MAIAAAIVDGIGRGSGTERESLLILQAIITLMVPYRLEGSILAEIDLVRRNTRAATTLMDREEGTTDMLAVDQDTTSLKTITIDMISARREIRGTSPDATIITTTRRIS
jgi:hypothetical protein